MASEWLDIASAPRDGSEADLFGYPLEDSTKPVRMTDCHFHCGEWLRWSCAADEEPGWEPVYLPTHWMPPPAPPTPIPAPGDTGDE